jgi:hypothetical protein
MAAAVVAAALAYSLLALTAGMVQPEGCEGWWDYIANLDRYD